MSDTLTAKKLLACVAAPVRGNVKQSFSHGRTKNVVVETKRKRVVVPKPGAAEAGGATGIRGRRWRRSVASVPPASAMPSWSAA